MESQVELVDLSNINKNLAQSIEDPMIGSLSIGEMHGIMLSESVKLDESKVLDNSSIKKHEEELNELNSLIS